MSARGTLVSILAWPLKGLVRTLLSPSLYQQVRVTLLGEQSGLGLDWRWANSLRRPDVHLLAVGTSVGRRDNRSIGIIPSSTFYRPVARIFAAGCWKSETIDIPGNSVRRRSRCRRSSIFTPTLPAPRSARI